MLHLDHWHVDGGSKSAQSLLVGPYLMSMLVSLAAQRLSSAQSLHGYLDWTVPTAFGQNLGSPSVTMYLDQLDSQTVRISFLDFSATRKAFRHQYRQCSIILADISVFFVGLIEPGDTRLDL